MLKSAYLQDFKLTHIYCILVTLACKYYHCHHLVSYHCLHCQARVRILRELTSKYIPSWSEEDYYFCHTSLCIHCHCHHLHCITILLSTSILSSPYQITYLTSKHHSDCRLRTVTSKLLYTFNCGCCPSQKFYTETDRNWEREMTCCNFFNQLLYFTDLGSHLGLFVMPVGGNKFQNSSWLL